MTGLHFTLHSVPHGTVPFDRLSRGGEGGASRLTARDTAKRPIPGALAAGCTTLEGTNSVGCRGGWVRACDGLSGRRRHDPPLPRPRSQPARERVAPRVPPPARARAPAVRASPDRLGHGRGHLRRRT